MKQFFVLGLINKPLPEIRILSSCLTSVGAPMYRLILLSILFLIYSGCHRDNPAPADVVLFQKFYEAPLADDILVTAIAADNAYVVACNVVRAGGKSSSALIMKIDKNGNRVWKNQFDDGNSCKINCIQLSNHGTYILAGTIFTDTGTDAFLTEISEDGRRIKSFTCPDKGDEAGYFIKQGPGQYYTLLGGRSSEDRDSSTLYTVKTDLKDYAEEFYPETTIPYNSDGAVQMLDDNRFMICQNVLRGKNPDIEILGFDEDLQFTWSRPFAGEEVSHKVNGAGLINNRFFLWGSKNADDAFIAEVDHSGNVLTSGSFGGDGIQEVMSVAQAADGQFMITGFEDHSGDRNIMVARVSKDFNLLWKKTLINPGEEIGNVVMAAENGRFVIFCKIILDGKINIGIYKISPAYED